MLSATPLSYLVIGLIFVEVVLQVFAASAVRGSHQRYVLLTFRRITSWMVNFAFIGQGLLQLGAGQYGTAAWDIVFGAICIIVEVRSHRNDDDWFNGRGKKIRNGLKKLFAPRPRATAATPVPAFG